MQNKKIPRDDRWDYLNNKIDQDKFSLSIYGDVTGEKILKVINLLKALHLHLGDTKEEIKKKYLQGGCISLASLIKSVFNSSEQLEFVRFTSPYDKMENELKQDFYDHFTARLKKEPNVVYDIEGAQTMEEMKTKLSSLWTKDGRMGKVALKDVWDNIDTYAISTLGGCTETSYCKEHISYNIVKKPCV